MTRVIKILQGGAVTEMMYSGLIVSPC